MVSFESADDMILRLNGELYTLHETIAEKDKEIDLLSKTLW